MSTRVVSPERLTHPSTYRVEVLFSRGPLWLHGGCGKVTKNPDGLSHWATIPKLLSRPAARSFAGDMKGEGRLGVLRNPLSLSHHVCRTQFFTAQFVRLARHRQLIAHEEGHQTATVITFPWLIYLTSVRTSLDLCELVATPLVDIIGTAVGIANFASAGPCDRCQELPHGRRHSSILSISASLNVFPALLMITARLVLHNRNIRTAMAAQNEAEPLST